MTSYCAVCVISKTVDATIRKEEETLKRTIDPTIYSTDETTENSRDKRRVGLARYWVLTNHDAAHPENRSFDGVKYVHSDHIPWGTK